jgi:hypothetical protein
MTANCLILNEHEVTVPSDMALRQVTVTSISWDGNYNNIRLCENPDNPSQKLEFFKSSLCNTKAETCSFSYPLVYFFNPFGVCFVQITLFCWMAYNYPRSEVANTRSCGAVKLREILTVRMSSLSKCTLFLQRLPGKVSGMQNEETLSLKLVECKTVFASFGRILWHS